MAESVDGAFWRSQLDVQEQVLGVVDEVLGLNNAARAWDSRTPLLGAVPELDSMAVVTLITSLEERFGISVADDEIDGSTFATVGALTEFIRTKLDA
jgi:acyl carrier protein